MGFQRLIRATLSEKRIRMPLNIGMKKLLICERCGAQPGYLVRSKHLGLVCDPCYDLLLPGLDEIERQIAIGREIMEKRADLMNALAEK